MVMNPETSPSHRPLEAEPLNVGILRKEDARKLEQEVVSQLKEMGHKFTAKEIAELMSTIDASKSL
jgi:hypothetical protein